MLEEPLVIPTLADDEERLPVYASKEAAGADLKAAIAEPLHIAPGETALIPTGIKVALPPGFEIQVRPRSGMALKHSVTVLNTPGTIDSDYRGEIGVILINHGKSPFVVSPGMRIAQAVIAKVIVGYFKRYSELPSTDRGSLGFGHTGTH